MAQKYETQAYEVVEKFDDVEIRFYPEAAKIKIKSEYSRNNNFRKLFQYIAGENSRSEKIAMTTPVYMSEDKQMMEFVLPKEYNSGSFPAPNSKEVEAYISSPSYFAVISYGGFSNNKKEKLYKEKLKETLDSNNISSIQPPQILYYDSPYKFFNRRNEVIVEVDFK
tara:strand:- start:8661 stop:9161 length:501 start_codon:yes stop_codon:yes gene_type:complete